MKEKEMRGRVVLAVTCAAILSFSFSTPAQAERFRPWVKDQIENLDSRVTQAESDIIDLSNAVVTMENQQAANPPGNPPGNPPAMRMRLVVVDAADAEMGPCFLLSPGRVRTVIDVAGVGLVSFDVREIDGEILKPANSNISNEVLWTGPGCTGTPFSGGTFFTPNTIPPIVSVASVTGGTYTLGQPLGTLTPMSADGRTLCQELELPHTPTTAVEVIRVGDFIGVTHPAPYSLELR